MIYLSTRQKKFYRILILLTAGAGFITLLPSERVCLYSMSSVAYLILLVTWGQHIRQRILPAYTRRLLDAACYLMIALFVLRILRYDVFAQSIPAGIYIWLLYYIPFTLVPLIAILLPEKRLWSRKNICVIVVEVFFVVLVLTNPLHGWILHINSASGVDSTYGAGYYFLFAIELLYTIMAFFGMIKKCAVSSARRLWYIPVMPAFVFFALLILYDIIGGSLKINGILLYKIQEVFCLIFISLFEGALAIGLIPSFSDYDDLFHDPHISMVLQDGADQPELSAEAIENDDRLRQAMEEIEEENELIRYENREAEIRESLKARNRLYDKSARYVQPQLARMECLIREFADNGDENALKLAAILGAYVKRRVNLMLIGEGRRSLSVEELILSVRESFEYLSLSDVISDVVFEGDTEELPVEMPGLFYDVLETVIEICYPDIQAIQTAIRCDSGGFEPAGAEETKCHLQMKISLAAGLPSDEIANCLKKYQDSIKMKVYREDDTLYVICDMGYTVQSRFVCES